MVCRGHDFIVSPYMVRYAKERSGAGGVTGAGAFREKKGKGREGREGYIGDFLSFA